MPEAKSQNQISAISQELQDSLDAVVRGEAQNSIPALPQSRKKARMRLPRVLITEACKIIFEHMERHAAAARGEKPFRWEECSPEYQAMWSDCVAVALEMGVTVILNDAIDVLDHSNGDLGGAFAKALRRYKRERLDGQPPV